MISDMNMPMRKPPTGILPTVILLAFTVMMFARIAILQYFENGIQLLACFIFILQGIISLFKDYFNCPIQNAALIKNL